MWPSRSAACSRSALRSGRPWANARSIGTASGASSASRAAQFDDVAHKIANFIDMRSAYTVGHSHSVARFAEGTASKLGLSSAEAASLRQAGLLHDLGRAGVPVSAWNKSEPLNEEEWERMRRHPSVTELVLSRSNDLGHLGMLAGMHHERLDGSGYRGMPAASLSIAGRVLAVADCYQTKLERRPHRRAMKP